MFLFYQPTEAGLKEQLQQFYTAATATDTWSRPGLFSGIV